MATTDLPRVVTDAGPLIHLDELECLDLLEDLGLISLPRAVAVEVARHRPQLSLIHRKENFRIVDVVGESSERLRSLIAALGLNAGERDALTLMEHLSAHLLLCDDAAARLAAESLGYQVRGTIGVLVRSIRTGKRSRQEIISLLKNLPHKSSLHISRGLLFQVIAEVEKSTT
jgi:predicted nucleic acid-binding protein